MASSNDIDLVSMIRQANSSWFEAIQGEFKEDYFKRLQAELQKDYADGKEIFPPRDQIFRAFNLTPLNKVKVVILGQDPYDDRGQAEGLSFSVPDGVRKPPSLKEIFKELTTDISGFKEPSSGSLVSWAAQGVLLLNSTLTVEAGKQNAHKSYGWKRFTDRVIKVISDQRSFVVFLLWGNFSHEKEKLIDGEKHKVIKTSHPSPMASYKGFLGSKCFSQTNDALKEKGLSPIIWNL